jgi:hypothetical protein
MTEKMNMIMVSVAPIAESIGYLTMMILLLVTML